jgi:hypothetical protein
MKTEKEKMVQLELFLHSLSPKELAHAAEVIESIQRLTISDKSQLELFDNCVTTQE